MKKIKVMHLIWSMKSGGAQQVLINYLEAFDDDPNIEMKLFVYNSRSDSKYDREIENQNYNVQYLNGDADESRIPILKYFINHIVAQKRWYEAIKSYEPDIVHIHLSGLLLHTLRPICKANVSVRFDTLHSNPYTYKGIKKLIIKKAFKKFNFVPICVSDDIAKKAKQWYGIDNYYVLHNGLNYTVLRKNQKELIDARKLINCPQDAYVVLGIGRLHKIKHFDLLIEAFSIAQKTKENMLLYIVGCGEEFSNLNSLADRITFPDTVKFIGTVDDPTIYYCSANVVAVTSYTESSSLVALESQILGIKTLVSDGIPKESIISSYVKQMKKNSSKEEWAKALIDDPYYYPNPHSMLDYDNDFVNNRLKEIYIENL